MFRWANITKQWLYIVVSLVSLGSPSATAQTPGAAQTQSVPPELEAVIDESDKALHEILNGGPSGYAALFADRDDITLGNPFGPFGKGRAAVIAALNNAAKKYTDGSVVRVERVAIYGGGDHYVLVEIEHIRAKLRTATDFLAFSARVTSVYEKIGARWKLVHRHADSITSARPAESVLSAIVPKGIVGTWRLVSFEDVEDGKIMRPAKSPSEGKWTIGPCLRAAPNKCRRCWTIPSLTGTLTPSIWPLEWLLITS